MKHETLTYVYGVVQSERRPAVPKSAIQTPGLGPPRSMPLETDELWAIVADASPEHFSEDALATRMQDLNWVSACAVTHDGMLRRIGRRHTVVPVRLMTVFTSDDRARAHLVRQRRRIVDALKSIAGCQEWGVRVWDDVEAREKRKGRAKEKNPESGTEFLRQKRAQYAHRSKPAAARAAAGKLYAQLARHARASVIRTDAELAGLGSRLLLDAAYLVPATRSAGFREAVARLSRATDTRGIRIELTGPWCPYNFIDA